MYHGLEPNSFFSLKNMMCVSHSACNTSTVGLGQEPFDVLWGKAFRLNFLIQNRRVSCG